MVEYHNSNIVDALYFFLFLYTFVELIKYQNCNVYNKFIIKKLYVIHILVIICFLKILFSSNKIKLGE